MMYVRFVHLLDKQKRQELMIIYAEDLTRSGYSAADLQKGGRFYDRWRSIDEAFVERGERASDERENCHSDCGKREVKD
jgi:hypothetical protein